MKLNSLTESQVKDASIAIIAFLLLFFIILKNPIFCYIAFIFCFFALLSKAGSKFIAYIWYSGSQFIGSIILKAVLTITFIFLLTPVGLIQKLFKKDSMLLKAWGSKKSAFVDRNYKFSPKDFEKTW